MGSSSRITLFLILQIILAKSQNPLESGVKTLLNLLEDVPVQGSPFPSIEGPSPRDRVCIVGAGPAGIHMALSLKRRNFSNVEIFEKSNRVGGKSFDIQLDKTNHPQGTIFLDPNYFENVIPLAQEFGLGEVVKLLPPTVWTTNDQRGGLSSGQYILSYVAQLTNSSSPEINIALIIKTTIKYVSLHKKLFGSYEGDMMLRPSSSTFYRVRGTFLDFLTREGMLPLVPVFKLTNTYQGYGQLDEISAIYALIWNNPKIIVATALRALGKDKEPLSHFILKNGFETIWKTIVETENIKVHYNIDIDSIKRNGHNVEIGIWKGAVIKREVCDWAIWTPSMIEFLKTSVDITHQEFSLVGSLTPQIFTASFVRMKNMEFPYNAYMKNMDDKIEHGVTGALSYKGLLDPRGLEGFGKNNTQSRSFYCLQLGSNFSNEFELNSILRNHFEQGYQAKNLEILSTISWSYFPRWSPMEMSSGRPWDVFETLQGRNRMWFAGSSVSFESIRGVMEYNNLLLRQYESRPQHSYFRNQNIKYTNKS